MILFGVQHLLPSLTAQMAELQGSKFFSRIVLFSKKYSNVPAAVEKLHAEIIYEGHEDIRLDGISGDESVIILDEGGALHDLLSLTPGLRASGVEQTTFGLRDDVRCPMVLACRSAAKLLFESQIIARGITRKLDSLNVLTPGVQIGVIGLGALGSEVARLLISMGHFVRGFDARAVPSDLTKVSVSIAELLATSDLVLGCAGKDVLHGWLSFIVGPSKIFVSCSSKDIEFRAVLDVLPRAGIYDTASGEVNGVRCAVLNGGYPINFDRQREWETPEEISLTRRLMIEGVYQATGLLGQEPQGIMLNPSIQSLAVRTWLDVLGPNSGIRVPSNLSVEFFRTNSEGAFIMGKKPYALHSTTPTALEQMRSHKKPYEVTVASIPITVMPNVWSPAYDWSSDFYIEHMPDVVGKSFLEIGSGTGVISVAAAKAGASQVVAVDVNPAAVANTRANFEKFKLGNATVIPSDGFNAIKGRFDVVTWNAPYHGSKPADDLERGCADEDYRDIKAFFVNVDKHLSDDGLILFGFSESGDLPLIKRLIKDADFRIVRTLSDWRQDYNCLLFYLERKKNKSAEGPTD